MLGRLSYALDMLLSRVNKYDLIISPEFPKQLMPYLTKHLEHN